MTIGRLSMDDNSNSDAIHLAAQTARSTVGKDVVAQTEEILDLIEADLREAGAERSDITLATIWLRDLSDFHQMNGIWSNWIADAALARRFILEDQNLPDGCHVRIRLTLSPK